MVLLEGINFAGESTIFFFNFFWKERGIKNTKNNIVLLFFDLFFLYVSLIDRATHPTLSFFHDLEGSATRGPKRRVVSKETLVVPLLKFRYRREEQSIVLLLPSRYTIAEKRI